MHMSKDKTTRRRRLRYCPGALVALGGVAAVLSLLSLPVRVLAGEGAPSWRFDLGVSSVYDDNILRYSDKYLSRFDNGEDPGRFHIKSRDDLILVSSIKASATMKLIGSLNTTASADVRRRTYTHNAVKDWYYYGANLRQDLSRKLSAQLGYSYIPGFYVRHYRDDDWVQVYGYTPATFQSYDFKKDELGGWVQYALFSTTRVRALASYMRYFYNEHFTEYDSKNSLFGFEIYHSFSKSFKVNGGFDIVYSRADGNTQTDASNDARALVLGADLQLPRVFGHVNSIGVEGEYTWTYFTTHNFLEVDVNHAGRRDYEDQVSVTYSFELLDNVNLALAYVWRQRMTETSALENANYLADEKNYSQYQIGLEARYSLNLVPSENSELERSK